MRLDRTAPAPSGGTIACRLALGLWAASLAGCGTSDRIKVSAIATDDYRVRHPIVLANEATTIDLFPAAAAGGLDQHTAKQVISFAADYRDVGHGPILVLLPRRGGADEGRSLVAGIRRALAAGGARARVEVSTYPVGDPGLASPVRLSFTGVRAKVADQCGQWPDDLASGATVNEWSNKPYYNFGCAYQSMIAAQAADPRDLVTPRGEEPADTLVRSRAIDSIRRGVDPSTTWSVHGTAINAVGAQ